MSGDAAPPAAPPRLFISYRAADGADKATALERELRSRFGDGPVFLDKADLAGGSRWREQIAGTLQARPVLLLLVTPLLLGARDGHGARRIDAADDPVRAEFEAALAAGAEVIPLLCDGLERPPAREDLPPSMAPLLERTWRKLRAYDWEADVARLLTDLRALGIAEPAPPPPPSAPRRRLVVIAAGAAALGAAVAGGCAWRARRAAGVGGRWTGEIGGSAHRARVTLVIEQQDEQLSLASEPIAIAGDPAWAAYRRFYRERFGRELRQVAWRGEGRLLRAPGQPPRIDIAITIAAADGGPPNPADGGEAVDSGNLSGTLAADRRTLEARFWSNGDQAEHPLRLARE